MHKEIKGFCLFLGILCLGYIALLLLAGLLTGAKVLKSVLLISVLSSCLISLGLTTQVKTRLSNYLKSLRYQQFA